jgi:hypothetical protein
MMKPRDFPGQFCKRITSSIGLIVVLASIAQTSAQTTYNPYDSMTSQFRNFSRPGGMNPFDSMSGNRSQSSTFQVEMDRLFGGRETSAGKSRDQDRYYNAFRKYDAEFDRLYRPNQDVDRAYNERRSSRENVYFKAFREKDPKKKAQLLRAFERGEDLAAIEDDMKPDDKSSVERRRSPASRLRDSNNPNPSDLSPSRTPRSRTGTGSGLLEFDRSSDPVRRPRNSGGLLSPSLDFDSSYDSESSRFDRPSSESLTDRSGRLSREFRPTGPARGYGSFRSRDEILKDQNKRNTGSQMTVPGLFP